MLGVGGVNTFLRKRKQREKCDVGLTVSSNSGGKVAMNLPVRVVHFGAKIARPLDPSSISH